MFFLNLKALESKWVKDEIKWAFEKEKEIGRIFILPILLEKDVMKHDFFKDNFEDIIYVDCCKKDNFSMKMTADYIAHQLFKLVCRRLEEQENAANASKKITQDSIYKEEVLVKEKGNKESFSKLADDYYNIALQNETTANYEEAIKNYLKAIDILHKR